MILENSKITNNYSTENPEVIDQERRKRNEHTLKKRIKELLFLQTDNLNEYDSKYNRPNWNLENLKLDNSSRDSFESPQILNTENNLRFNSNIYLDNNLKPQFNFNYNNRYNYAQYNKKLSSFGNEVMRNNSLASNSFQLNNQNPYFQILKSYKEFNKKSNFLEKLNDLNKNYRKDNKSKINYIKNYSHISKASISKEGYLNTKNNFYFEIIKLNNDINSNIFGICNVNGTNGDKISRFIGEELKEYYQQIPIDDYKIEELIDYFVKDDYANIKNCIKSVEGNIIKYKDKLKMEKDNFASFILLMHLNNKIICVNRGNCHAILIKDRKKIVQLTNKHIYEEIEKEKEQKIVNLNDSDIIKDICDNKINVENKTCNENNNKIDNKIKNVNQIFNINYNLPNEEDKKEQLEKDKNLWMKEEIDIIEKDIDGSYKYIIMGTNGLFDNLSEDYIRIIGNSFYSKNDCLGLCYELANKCKEECLHNKKEVDEITVCSIILNSFYK